MAGQTANKNTTTLRSSDTAILDTFIPGYTFISSLLISYLQIDLSSYVPYILAAAAFGAALKYCFSRISHLLKCHFVSSAEIRVDDEMYNYLMFWLAKQPFVTRTRKFVAGTRWNGTRYWDYEADDSDDGSELEGSNADLSANFDDYWSKALTRDKYKKLRFTPAEGTHYFVFRGRFLCFSRVTEEQRAPLLRPEKLYLSCLGRDPGILKELLTEAQRAYVERDGAKIVIYRGQKDFGNFDWVRCMARPPRPLSTVVLDEAQKQAFVDDLKDYLHPRTKRWYFNRGIPYRRGYLLHGPPGTGKTSLCSAAAGLLGLKLYLLNLNSSSLDEDGLVSLFNDLPRWCIVLLEDVDSAGITQKRTASSDDNKDTDNIAAPSSTGMPPDENADAAPKSAKHEKGITLSVLLNVIDGVAATEGRILVMTTNHADKLDPALLRPGRVDMAIEFGYASKSDIEELFSAIYMSLEGDLPRLDSSSSAAEMKEKGSVKEVADKESERVRALAKRFAASVPEDEFTPAEIQGFLLNHKGKPEEALDEVGEWVRRVKNKKDASA